MQNLLFIFLIIAALMKNVFCAEGESTSDAAPVEDLRPSMLLESVSQGFFLLL